MLVDSIEFERFLETMKDVSSFTVTPMSSMTLGNYVVNRILLSVSGTESYTLLYLKLKGGHTWFSIMPGVKDGTASPATV